MNWRKASENLILKTLREHPCETRQDAERILRGVYPFGERKYAPYKAWLKAKRRILDALFPVKRKVEWETTRYFAPVSIDASGEQSAITFGAIAPDA